MRTVPRFLALMFLLGMVTGTTAAQNKPTAEQIFSSAKAKAAAEHKNIFLIFGASWCGPCKSLDKFLADGEVRPILDKYFVIAELSILEELGKKPELNNPGADRLVAELGGKSSGVPYIVFLNEQGRRIVASTRPWARDSHGGNIGYPVTSPEIAWFMSMLNKSVPTMSKADAHTIESWLQAAAGA